jgi:hypothetical protein
LEELAVPLVSKCACGKQLRARDELAGKRVKCPACGRAVNVPGPSRAGGQAAVQAETEVSAAPVIVPRAAAPAGGSANRRLWLVVGGAGVSLCLAVALVAFLLSRRDGGLEDRALPTDGLQDKALARDGPGDLTLTFDEVSKNPAKYRGKRVTWPFVPCSTENETMLCSLDAPAERRPGATRMYLVKFASVQEASNDRLLLTAAFSSGSTITGTVAGEVETNLVHRDRLGVPQSNMPRVRLPLLLYPVYTPPANNNDKK